ncbi:sulfurtransferase TusA family protein [Pseudooceanicola onchidii]|uniref:sulfurtransferase TusA family protein n=1 Tax=Pseudooceanicola onchidii TaxID=2562279 RepID=UPI0010AA4DE1|nr:sulfurtransferase TusA family protein [Pseudooceanicola onchidii]
MDDVDIDARGLICPLPVLRLRKRLMGVSAGAELTMLSDDPVAAIDIPHFCASEGHEVIENRDMGAARFFRVRRGQ